jgi:hypothetical protein
VNTAVFAISFGNSSAKIEVARKTMRTINRRLCRLEKAFVPQVDEEGMRLVALLLARRRRWAQEPGEPVEVRPRAVLIDVQDRPQTVVAILQTARQRLAEAPR